LGAREPRRRTGHGAGDGLVARPGDARARADGGAGAGRAALGRIEDGRERRDPGRGAGGEARPESADCLTRSAPGKGAAAMEQATTEALFLAWRTTSDLRALAQVFDETAP